MRPFVLPICFAEPERYEYPTPFPDCRFSVVDCGPAARRFQAVAVWPNYIAIYSTAADGVRARGDQRKGAS